MKRFQFIGRSVLLFVSVVATVIAAEATTGQRPSRADDLPGPNDVLPLIWLDNIPLPDALDTLSQLSGNPNFILDPHVPGSCFDPGRKIPAPLVFYRRKNVTPRQALQEVLKKYKLVMSTNLVTGVVRFAPAGFHREADIASDQFRRCERKAHKGDANAQFELACRLLTGVGEVTNKSEAVRWLRKAVSQKHSEAVLILGWLHEFGDSVEQDSEKALTMYKKAAAQGLPDGYAYVGQCYSFGYGVAPDYPAAIQWYLKGGEKGSPLAQHNLGHCYMIGKGVQANPQEALKWMRKAVEQNYPPAYERLGSWYREGRGVPQNYTTALELFRQGASGGLTTMFDVGSAYYRGEGVKVDVAEAYKWFLLAARKGHPQSQRIVTIMEKNGLLSPEQRHEAQLAADRAADSTNCTTWAIVRADWLEGDADSETPRVMSRLTTRPELGR